MKQIAPVISIIFISFVLSGCAIVTSDTKTTGISVRGAEHIFPSENAIRKLSLGVSRQEVITLIGRSVTTGYELKEGTSDEYQPTTTANPYRSQKITKGNDVYEVDYYLTRVRKADGVVSDDELTPVVFQSDKLIGKGWEFFNSSIKR